MAAKIASLNSKLEGLDNIVLNELANRERAPLTPIDSRKKRAIDKLTPSQMQNKTNCFQILHFPQQKKGNPEQRTKSRMYSAFQSYKLTLLKIQTPKNTIQKQKQKGHSIPDTNGCNNPSGKETKHKNEQITINGVR